MKRGFIIDIITAKDDLEKIMGTEVGSLIEIKKTFTNFEKYFISVLPEFKFWDKDRSDILRAYLGSKRPDKNKPYEEPLYLIGFNPFIDKSTNSISVHKVSTNDLNILLDLISLVKEPINYNDLENSFNNEEILSYCSKYALPLFQNNNRNDNYNNIYEYSDETRQFLYSRIPLKEFYIEVTRLYLLFSLWKSIMEEKEDDSKRYAMQLDDDLQNFNVIKYRDILSFYIDKVVMNNTHLRFSNLKISQLYLDADSILTMCYFQLASLTTKTIEETNKHFKICKGCTKLIWMPHGNSRYCDNCNRKTIWSQKKRQTNKNMEV